MTDEISKGVDIGLSETVALTDSIIKILDVSLTESINLSDTTTAVVTLSLTESITFADAMSNQIDKQLLETISLTDITNEDVEISLSETIVLTDSVFENKMTDVRLTEMLSFSFEYTAADQWAVFLYEDVQFDERLLSPLHLTEGVSFSDSVKIHIMPGVVNLYALPAEDKVTLAWTNQSDPRANPMKDYVIEHSNDNGATWQIIYDNINDTTRAYTVEQYKDGAFIENGQNTLFRVQAINILGTSEFSEIQSAKPESDDNEFVREVEVISLPESFKVTWEPHPDYVSDIVDYLIYYANTPNGPWTLHDDGYGAGFTKYPIAQHPSGPSVTIEGISTFEPTFVKIASVLESNNKCAADDDEGPGASQIAWTLPLKQPPKQIPSSDISPFAESNSVTLEWKEPSSVGSEVYGFEIQYGMKMGSYPVTFGDPIWTSSYYAKDANGDYSYKIDYLAGSTNYHFQIRGVSAIGDGAWSASVPVQTKAYEVKDYSSNTEVWWGDDYVDNDYDGSVDEADEQKYGAAPLAEGFDYSAAGAKYGDNQAFDGTKEFGAGQAFGDGTAFSTGQIFDDDMNFSGDNIKYDGAEFRNAAAFGDGAAFTGTQSFTGQNTFGDSTVFTGSQDFGSATQTFGAGVKFNGVADFANGQAFAKDTAFADGQTFDANEDYDFDAEGLGFGAGTAFGRAEEFGIGAEFDDGAVDFYGTNTFGAGTKFAAGQDFDSIQVFGQGVDFGAGTEFADGQTFALDFDFNETGMEFGASTVFCGEEEFGEGADFSEGVQTFKGTNTFATGTKFGAGQNFETAGVQTFGASTEFKGTADFADGQAFATGTKFASGQAFEDGETYDFSGEAIAFGAGVNFGAAREFGASADFSAGVQTFEGTNTFATGTKFGAGQNFETAGVQTFGASTEFKGTADFADGQAFATGTKFASGQAFEDGETYDFSGEAIAFGAGVNFGAAREFGASADFSAGVQTFEGTNTFATGTKFGAGQAFDTAQTFAGANTFDTGTKFGAGQAFDTAQTFGASTEFKGTADFADGQAFATGTKFASGQAFEDGETYDFSGEAIEFGAGVNFGAAREFGASADFSAGVQTFAGANTFDTGTKFGAGQAFDTAQTFGASTEFKGTADFADNQEFATGTKFASGQAFDANETYDFDATSMYFGASTNFGQAREFGASADFSAGVQTFEGANTFDTGTKFGAGQAFDAAQTFGADLDFAENMEFADGQAFDSYIYEFEDYVDFGADTEFRAGQDFDGAVEFSGLFDYDDMKGKALVFNGDVDFFMPPPVETSDGIYVAPLGIPAGTTFGDAFDYEDMFTDANGDGVNDEYYKFDPGVVFAADTKFPPNVEFSDGFSFNDMNGKEFTFNEGIFMGGDPHFPSGQTIKPGILWGGAPKFDPGVVLEPGLAIPEDAEFSQGLALPAGTAPPYGMLLAPITCTDAECIPDPSAYLAPGELLPPGVDPAPVINYITASNSTFANPGLGFEMAFDTVAKDGKVSVDLQDPVKVPGTTPGAVEGQRSMATADGSAYQNVGSIIDVSVSTAEASGEMTITLPYDETTLDGIPEDEVVLLHYTNGEWVTVQNITIDKINNKVSGTVTSLSPFTVGTQSPTVSTGGSSASGNAGGSGGGAGNGAVISEDIKNKSGYPSLNIVEVTYDTNADIVRVVVSPEFDVMDVIIKTSTGFETATKIASHSILNQATYEVQLLADRGPLQVSAIAFVKSIVIEAIPVITTISAGTETIRPNEYMEPPVIITAPEEFQKPDDFITDKQCPLGMSLVDGKCAPQTLQEQPLTMQFAVILLLVLLAVGLLLAIGLRKRIRKEIVSSQLLFESEDELIRSPSIPETLPPSVRLPELVEEKSELAKLLQTLHTQEAIQKELHLLETQLLEHVKEEAQIRERLTTLLQLVEIRIHLVEPLSLQQLKALPAPRRTYKKKRKVLSQEHKIKIAAARRGKTQTEETKQKIAGTRRGRKMSEEHKAKIAAARRGKTQTEETKQKIAESRRGRMMSESTKQRISKSKKTRKNRVNKKNAERDELIKRYNIVSEKEYSDE